MYVFHAPPALPRVTGKWFYVYRTLYPNLFCPRYMLVRPDAWNKPLIWETWVQVPRSVVPRVTMFLKTLRFIHWHSSSSIIQLHTHARTWHWPDQHTTSQCPHSHISGLAPIPTPLLFYVANSCCSCLVFIVKVDQYDDVSNTIRPIELIFCDFQPKLG